MKSRRIDDQVREHYGRQRLSDDARAHIKAKLRGAAQPKAVPHWWWMKTAVAAGVAIAITAAALWFTVARGSAPDSPDRLAASIAQQAATQHNQQQELEFRADRATDLRREMKSLDFTPVEPELMANMNMRLVGARYTTIEGVMAAQILYLDPKGEPCTLYQARPVEKLARVPAGAHIVDGLRVNVWHEKGLLMVLARPAA